MKHLGDYYISICYHPCLEIKFPLISISRLPGIVFVAISFPLDEVLESSLVPTTVEYLFYFPLCFSVDDYGQWVVFCLPACNWVIWGWSKLHHIEHWMELLHPVWQL